MRLLDKGLALLLIVSSIAGAQDPQRGGGRGRRAGGPPADSAPGRGRGAAKGQREARQAIEGLIRRRLQPSDAQMKQLQALDAKYEPQRVALMDSERDLRRELRAAMLDTVNVNQPRIAQLLDQLIRFPGKRAALLEAEQKDLSGILSPLQRAKYQAIQEELRRRIEQGRGGPPPNRPPPQQGSKK